MIGLFDSTRKSTLAAQLRVHFAKQGYPLEEMFKRSDDTVIGMIAGRCDWCGETHVYGKKLGQLIAVSVSPRKNMNPSILVCLASLVSLSWSTSAETVVRVLHL